MKKIFAFVLFLFVFSTAGFAQNNEQYSAALKKMFEVSGSNETYKAAIKQMLSIYKSQSSNVNEEKWNSLEAELMKTSLTELVDLLVPVYQKYMTLSDINEMIKFYETPVGQKYAKSAPKITQESMQIGQQWGMKLGQEIQKKLK